MSTERDSRLQWIYASQGEAQLRERYDVWAADYDRDLDELKWSAPQAGAERCAHFAKPGAEILDAGCGTGLVGVALAAPVTHVLSASTCRRECWNAAQNAGCIPSCTRARCSIGCRSTMVDSGRSCRSACSRSAMSTARRSPSSPG